MVCSELVDGDAVVGRKDGPKAVETGLRIDRKRADMVGEVVTLNLGMKLP